MNVRKGSKASTGGKSGNRSQLSTTFHGEDSDEEEIIGEVERIQMQIEKTKKDIVDQKSKCSDAEIVYKEVAEFSQGDSFGEYSLVDNRKGTR